MQSIFKRASIVALIAAALVVPAEAMSLREKIEARRKAAEAQAMAAHAAQVKQQAVQEAMQVDPEKDPNFWRITKYAIPGKRMFGITVAGGGEARFYANAPRDRWDPEYGEGTDLYFYEHGSDGILHLAGRGRVRKYRLSGRNVVIEATIDAFRYARGEQRRTPQGWQAGVTVQKLTHGKNPRQEKWYMSTRLTGPETIGWTMDHREAFARRLLWLGMSEWAVYATLGQPESKIEGAGETRLIFNLGINATTSANLSQEMGGAQIISQALKQRVSIRDGRVIGLDPKQKVQFH